MLPNFLIGLREGLEATLVVSILVAYLMRTGRRDRLLPVWLGVGGAVAMSLAFGALLTFTASNLSFAAKEAFGGILSLIAVGFVTWMIFWMRRASRGLRAELEHRVDAAVSIGTGALVVTSFLAVGREGLETALFLWAAIQSTSQTTEPLVGAALGLTAAVALGWLLYRRAITIDLRRFFTWTGAGLIVVAAGVLAYGLHDLQEAGILPGLNTIAFDVSTIIPPASWYGTLLKGILNFSPRASVLEVVAWAGYLAIVMTLFFRTPSRVPQHVA